MGHPTDRHERAAGFIDDDAIAALHRIVAEASSRMPSLADEFESEAWVTLWKAALSFDPALMKRFQDYFVAKLRQSIVDVVRLWHGRTGGPRNRAGVMSLDRPGVTTREDCDGPTFRDTIPSDDPPVGWAADHEDTVDALLRCLPGHYRDVMERLYLKCPGTCVDVARRRGVSEVRISDMRSEALRDIRWIAGIGGAA